MKVRWTGKTANSKSASLLTFAAIAGVIGTAALAAYAENKAAKQASDPEMTPEEKTRDRWKFYAPAGMVFWMTAMCIVQSNQLNRRRNKAILTAYVIEPFFSDFPAN
jgi:invasion protein IalB